MIAKDTPDQQNIVLALDGSADSWAALELVRDLPFEQGVRVHVLSVILPREASLKAWALMAMLDQAKEKLAGFNGDVEAKLLSGYPAEEMMEYCEVNHPDLIVMGATGLRATLGILLGGVAQQIVEYACCPVLIVRGPYQGLQRVLLVVDGSPSSDRAVQYLASFPFGRKSDLRVMHVLPPTVASDFTDVMQWQIPPEPSTRDVSEAEELAIRLAREDEARGSSLLSGTVESLKRLGLDASGCLKRGDAATEIIGYIKKNKIDMVVAGSRGLSQVQSWLLGSVSRKLVHYAGCSVLIVKQPAGL